MLTVSKKVWKIANKQGGYSLAFLSNNRSSINAYKSKANLLKSVYGLQAEMIKGIELANIKFLESRLLYEVEMKDKRKIVKKIKKINERSVKLIESRIDRYVRLYENENPAFYNEYSKLRESQMQTGILDKENKNQVQTEDLAGNKPVKKSEPPKLKPVIQPKTTSVKEQELSGNNQN